MAEALEHGGSCSRCALRLEEQQALTAELRSLAEEMKIVETPSHLESRLMEAFRGGKRSPQRTQATPRAWFGVAAVAAVLLIVVGGVALRLSWAPPASPLAVETGSNKTTNNDAPPPVVPVRTVLVSETPTDRGLVSQPSRKGRKHRVKRVRDSISTLGNNPAIASTAAVEVTTDFMQLGDVSVVNLQEGAQVVRVEMPRYAMARFGLPVNMERYDERVKADVWLGADGLARAIRFVQ